MENTGTLKGNVEDYIEHKIDLVKLQAADKSGSVISGVVISLVVARLSLFVIIFFSFAGAYAISEALGKYYWGFLIVGGFYLLLAVIFIVFREKLVTMPIINSLLKKLKYKEHNG